VQNLFDQYARTFDKHLEFLRYRAPELIYAAVSDKLDLAAKRLVILDLGCGTGPCGEKFRSVAARLIGIDLSKNMLAAAKQKNIYDELRLGNIEAVTAEYMDVDLIVAADTLVYCGDLIKIFAACSNALAANGMFAFTVEKTTDYPYVLQQSARFAHAEKYIEDLVTQDCLRVVSCENVVVRNQYNLPVESHLYVLKKC
jgi:predicted TPR repeat methyltransferase